MNWFTCLMTNSFRVSFETIETKFQSFLHLPSESVFTSYKYMIGIWIHQYFIVSGIFGGMIKPYRRQWEVNIYPIWSKFIRKSCISLLRSARNRGNWLIIFKHNNIQLNNVKKCSYFEIRQFKLSLLLEISQNTPIFK